MLKIFVTGDNHIGLKYARYEKAALLSEARISAFEAMVETANSENCDIFAITGDLFENTYSISKKEVKALLEILSGFNGIVAVLPGNHDYYDSETKLWQYFEDVLKSTDNIMLLSASRPYPIEINGKKVVFYPAPCTSLHSLPGQNNLTWIKNTPIPQDSAWHIGIAHGAVEGETIDNEGLYFLMSRPELDSIPLDLWLIGHTHVPFPDNLTESFSESERIFNPGTHVQTDLSCNSEGICFIIEIDEDKSVRAKKAVTGNIRFYRKHIHLSGDNIKESLSSSLSEIGDNSVVDIILSGAVTSEEYENRAEIISFCLSRFIEGTYSDYSLSKLISKELIEKEFPETSLSAKLLGSLLSNPKEAQLAYELLKSLKEGK